jgi:hypothetical protein
VLEQALQLFLSRVSPLTFGVIRGTGNEIESVTVGAGSGTFIAPMVGLTAKHVNRSLFVLEPGGDPGYHREPTRTNHIMNLFQVLEPGNPFSKMAFWHVHESSDLLHSDLSLLFATGDGGEAFAMEKAWSNEPVDLLLHPPPIGSTVQAFGYPSHSVHSRGSEVFIDTPVMLVEGVVTEVYSPFRDRGFMAFPCFRIETPIPIDHGFSGGPIFLEERLCGVLSAASNFDNGAYAATLWPLLRSGRFADYCRTGVIRASGWQDWLARITVVQDQSGAYLDLR